MSDWTAEVAGRMHTARITGLEQAKEAGISNTYLSAVLNRKKGNQRTQERVLKALKRLEERKHEDDGENTP